MFIAYLGGDFAVFGAISAIFLGFASGLFHWFYDHEKWGKRVQAADELGMYMLMSAMIIRSSAFSVSIGGPIIIGIWLICALFWRKMDSHVYISYGAAWLAGALFAHHHFWAVLATLIAGIAMVVWLIDRPKYHGRLHPYWHLGMSVALGLVWWLS